MNMGRKGKKSREMRLLAVLAVLAVAFAGVFAIGLAYDVDDSDAAATPPSGDVAEVQDEHGGHKDYYKSLQAAVDAAAVSDKVILLNDVVIDTEFVLKNGISLDVNKKIEITGAGSLVISERGAVYVNVGGTIINEGSIEIKTVKDETNNTYYGSLVINKGVGITNNGTIDINGSMTVDGTISGNGKIISQAESTVDNGGKTVYYGSLYAAFDHVGNESTIQVLSDATVSEVLNVNSNSIEICLKNAKVNFNGTYICCDGGGSLKITGDGEMIFDSPASYYGLPSAGILFAYSGSGVLTLGNGVKVTSNTTAVLCMDGEGPNPNVVIEGAIVTGTDYAIYTQGVNINISSGKINGAIIFADSQGKFDPSIVDITGGTFSVNPTPYLTEEYVAEPVANNKFSVVLKPEFVVAEIVGGKQFPTLQEAIDAAKSGQTVTLLKDVNGDRISITKSVTINGNGYTLTDTNANGRAIWIDATGVTLNLKNLTIDGQGKCQRGIQVNQLDNGNSWNVAVVNVDNCIVKGITHYAINMCLNTTVDLTITDSEITGWAAINAYGTGNKILVERSVLNGVNDKSLSDWNNFCTVCLEGDTTGHSTVGSADYIVEIVDSTITAKQTTGNYQAAIGFNTNSANSSVTLTNTKVILGDKEKCYNFYDNGTNNSILVKSGCIFDASPDKDYISKDCEIRGNSDGTYEVVRSYVAEAGGKFYYTLEEALRDGAGLEVTLLKDVQLIPEDGEQGVIIPSIYINDDMVINLNGKTISWADSAKGKVYKSVPVFLAIGQGTVTITGNGTMDADLGADNSSYCVNLYEYSWYAPTVSIENGKFLGSPTAIQVQKGTLNVVGGTFDLTTSAKDSDSKYIVNCIDGSFADETAKISITGGTFGFNPNDNPEGPNTTYLAAGYEAVTKDSVKYTVSEIYIAEINGVRYPSLQAAVDAAKQGDVINLLGSFEGNGVKVPAGKILTFDFNTFTYTVNTKTVGSTGTETNGFQLLEGATVVMKNGTLDAGTSAQILIQKYCDLVLENITLVGGPQTSYVVSNNNGTTVLKGNTNITAAENKVAFDVYYWPEHNYGDNYVFTENLTGTITGKIEHTHDNTSTNDQMKAHSGIILNSGTYTVDPSAFVADGYVTVIAGSAFTIGSESDYPFVLGGKGYATLQDAWDSTIAGKITLTRDVSGPGITVADGRNLTLDLNGYTYTVTGNGFTFDSGSEVVLMNGGISTELVTPLIVNKATLYLTDVNVLSKGTALENLGGTATLSGSTSIDATDALKLADGAAPGLVKTENLAGTVKGLITVSGNNTLSIDSGSFDAAISDFLAEGYSQTKYASGLFGAVKTADVIAEFGEYKFTTLQDAVDAAAGKTTIVLTKNAEGNGVTVPAGKDIVFDFGGFTYTIAADAAIQKFVFETNATVEMTNGTLTTACPGKVIENNAALTIGNITIDANAASSSLDTYGGVVKIGAGSVLTSVQFALRVYDGSAGTVEIDGAVMNGQVGLYNESNNKVTVVDGTFNDKIVGDSGNMEIRKGTFADVHALLYVAKNGVIDLIKGFLELAEKEKLTVRDVSTISVLSGEYIALMDKANLVLPTGTVFSGKITGPTPVNFIEGVFKSGKDPISITGGSITINGETLSSGTKTVEGADITVNGNDVTIKGTFGNEVDPTKKVVVSIPAGSNVHFEEFEQGKNSEIQFGTDPNDPSKITKDPFAEDSKVSVTTGKGVNLSEVWYNTTTDQSLFEYDGNPHTYSGSPQVKDGYTLNGVQRTDEQWNPLPLTSKPVPQTDVGDYNEYYVISIVNPAITDGENSRIYNVKMSWSIVPKVIDLGDAQFEKVFDNNGDVTTPINPAGLPGNITLGQSTYTESGIAASDAGVHDVTIPLTVGEGFKAENYSFVFNGKAFACTGSGSDYSVTIADAGLIKKKPVSVVWDSGNSDLKYTGDDRAGDVNASFESIGGSVNLDVSYSGVLKNVGDNLKFTASIPLAYSDNYEISGSATASYGIKPVTIALEGKAEKTYDGKTVLVSGPNASVFTLGAGAVNITIGTQEFETAGVGDVKRITLTFVLGADSVLGNYMVSYNGTQYTLESNQLVLDTAGVVKAAPVTVDAIKKTYDGDNTITLSDVRFNGVLATEVAGFLKAAVFDGSNAGAREVTLTLDSSKAANYVFTDGDNSVPGGETVVLKTIGSIDKAKVRMTGTITKVYNGADDSLYATSSLAIADSPANISMGTVTFDTVNVKDSVAVSIQFVLANLSVMGNYVFEYNGKTTDGETISGDTVSFDGMGKITALEVELTGTAVKTFGETYNGNEITIQKNGTNISISGLEFVDFHAGDVRNVKVTFTLDSGSVIDNYTFKYGDKTYTSADGTITIPAGKINRLDVDITGSVTKDYDGTDVIQTNGMTLTGFGITGHTEAFAAAVAGTTGIIIKVTLDGSLMTDYKFIYNLVEVVPGENGALTVDAGTIYKKVVTIPGSNVECTYGEDKDFKDVYAINGYPNNLAVSSAKIDGTDSGTYGVKLTFAVDAGVSLDNFKFMWKDTEYAPVNGVSILPEAGTINKLVIEFSGTMVKDYDGTADVGAGEGETQFLFPTCIPGVTSISQAYSSATVLENGAVFTFVFDKSSKNNYTLKMDGNEYEWAVDNTVNVTGDMISITPKTVTLPTIKETYTSSAISVTKNIEGGIGAELNGVTISFDTYAASIQEDDKTATIVFTGAVRDNYKFMYGGSEKTLVSAGENTYTIAGYGTVDRAALTITWDGSLEYTYTGTIQELPVPEMTGVGLNDSANVSVAPSISKVGGQDAPGAIFCDSAVYTLSFAVSGDSAGNYTWTESTQDYEIKKAKLVIDVKNVTKPYDKTVVVEDAVGHSAINVPGRNLITMTGKEYVGATAGITDIKVTFDLTKIANYSVYYVNDSDVETPAVAGDAANVFYVTTTVGITKKPLTFDWTENGSYEYKGTTFDTPSVRLDGAIVDDNVTGSVTQVFKSNQPVPAFRNAGDYYFLVELTGADKDNYSIPAAKVVDDVTCHQKISVAKHTLDIGSEWADKTYTYDGTEHEIPVHDVMTYGEDSLTFKTTIMDAGYQTNAAQKIVDAGTYYLKAEIVGELAGNYILTNDQQALTVNARALTYEMIDYILTEDKVNDDYKIEIVIKDPSAPSANMKDFTIGGTDAGRFTGHVAAVGNDMTFDFTVTPSGDTNWSGSEVQKKITVVIDYKVIYMESDDGTVYFEGQRDVLNFRGSFLFPQAVNSCPNGMMLVGWAVSEENAKNGIISNGAGTKGVATETTQTYYAVYELVFYTVTLENDAGLGTVTMSGKPVKDASPLPQYQIAYGEPLMLFVKPVEGKVVLGVTVDGGSSVSPMLMEGLFITVPTKDMKLTVVYADEKNADGVIVTNTQFGNGVKVIAMPQDGDKLAATGLTLTVGFSYTDSADQNRDIILGEKDITVDPTLLKTDTRNGSVYADVVLDNVTYGDKHLDITKNITSVKSTLTYTASDNVTELKAYGGQTVYRYIEPTAPETQL